MAEKSLFDNLLTNRGMATPERSPKKPEPRKPKPTAEEGDSAEKIATLERKIALIEKAPHVVEIDPQLICATPYKDRSEAGFHDAMYQTIKASIERFGQDTPIKVRPKASLHTGNRYEIIAGHRRHRACQELGIPVKCLVEHLDDQRLVLEMDRENAEREGLSPIESARRYQLWLDKGLFADRNAILEQTGKQKGWLSKLMSLLEIPQEILACLEDERALSLRAGYELAGACKQPERLAAMRELKLELKQPRYTDEERIQLLLRARPEKPKAVVEEGESHRDGKGHVYVQRKKRTLRFSPKAQAAFVEYVWSQLPALKAQWETENNKTPS